MKFALLALCFSAVFMRVAPAVAADPAPTPVAQKADADQASAKPSVGQLELVADLDITPGNVTVSRTGRIFASVHGMRRGTAQLIEIFPGKNQWKPFPDAAWNAAPGSGDDVLNTAHGVAIDNEDRLWVIDHGNWMPDGQPVAQPKLVAYDIGTGKEVFRMDFDEAAAPEGQILQDLAVDGERGFCLRGRLRQPGGDFGGRYQAAPRVAVGRTSVTPSRRHRHGGRREQTFVPTSRWLAQSGPHRCESDHTLGRR